MYMNAKRNEGFTLIELLVVMVIAIMIVSMVATAALKAKTRAQFARARAETRQLTMAWRVYATLYRELPHDQTDVPMTADNLTPLLGYSDAGGANKLKRTFLEFPPDSDFVDPWDTPYYVNFVPDEAPKVKTMRYKVSASFPLRNKPAPIATP